MFLTSPELVKATATIISLIILSAIFFDIRLRLMEKQMDAWRDAVLDSLDDQFKAQVAAIEEVVVTRLYHLTSAVPKPRVLEYPDCQNPYYPAITEETKNNAEKLKAILDTNKPKGTKNPPSATAPAAPAPSKPAKKATGKVKK